jgi:NADPH:quinone reductase-like Zn-dependent oxidoreductase
MAAPAESGAHSVKLLKRALLVLAGLLVVAIAAGAIALSHTRACPAAGAPVVSGGMKAIVYRCYGAPEVLKLEDIEKPAPKEHEVLVRVRAASVNPLDWHFMRGKPYVMRLDAGLGAPDNMRIGVDFAGVVEAVGPLVTRFKVGDEVFGGKRGAFAEYVAVSELRAVVLKPASVSFAQAAAVPIAGLTALQGLRDKAHVGAGQKVLINGASGGVGTFAVQIARDMGAEVTGVCSTRNVELVRSLGAAHVIDYTREDFTEGSERYDVIFDSIGNHSVLALRRVLTPQGTLVVVGAPTGGAFLGGLTVMLDAVVVSPFVSQHLEPFLAELNAPDLTRLAELMQANRLTSVIDRTYPLAQTPEAIAYLEAGHARGKVVIAVE